MKRNTKIVMALVLVVALFGAVYFIGPELLATTYTSGPTPYETCYTHQQHSVKGTCMPSEKENEEEDVQKECKRDPNMHLVWQPIIVQCHKEEVGTVIKECEYSGSSPWLGEPFGLEEDGSARCVECKEDDDCTWNRNYEGQFEDLKEGYIGEPYCEDGDIYRDYRTWSCEDSGCVEHTEEKLRSDCEVGCENGRCIGATTTTAPTTTTTMPYIPTVKSWKDVKKFDFEEGFDGEGWKVYEQAHIVENFHMEDNAVYLGDRAQLKNDFSMDLVDGGRYRLVMHVYATGDFYYVRESFSINDKGVTREIFGLIENEWWDVSTHQEEEIKVEDGSSADIGITIQEEGAYGQGVVYLDDVTVQKAQCTEACRSGWCVDENCNFYPKSETTTTTTTVSCPSPKIWCEDLEGNKVCEYCCPEGYATPNICGGCCEGLSCQGNWGSRKCEEVTTTTTSTTTTMAPTTTTLGCPSPKVWCEDLQGNRKCMDCCSEGYATPNWCDSRACCQGLTCQGDWGSRKCGEVTTTSTTTTTIPRPPSPMDRLQEFFQGIVDWISGLF